MEIRVIKVDPNTGRVTFELQSKFISGIDLLVQVVVLSLLNVQGQDVLDPEQGGGLPALIGQNIDPNDPTEIFADVALRVKKTQAEMISNQIGLEIPASERLREVTIVSIEQGANIDEILVRLRVSNEEGRTTDVVI